MFRCHSKHIHVSCATECSSIRKTKNSGATTKPTENSVKYFSFRIAMLCAALPCLHTQLRWQCGIYSSLGQPGICQPKEITKHKKIVFPISISNDPVIRLTWNGICDEACVVCIDSSQVFGSYREWERERENIANMQFARTVNLQLVVFDFRSFAGDAATAHCHSVQSKCIKPKAHRNTVFFCR